MNQPKVNIIIPVHNRPDHTRQTIESLYKNTPRDLFNLMVVDDASEMETAMMLADFMKEFNFDLTRYGEAQGPAYCRNNAAKSFQLAGLQREYIYHSDNDVYFTPGWLEKLITAYEDMEKAMGAEVLVLGGSCHPFLQTSKVLYVGAGYKVGQKDAVSGYSQLMTWETWEKYGPFDENQGSQPEKIMGSEDWAFCQRIVKDGFKVGSIEPEVVIPCGKTNTYGKPATGAETFKEFPGVKVL